MILKNVSVLKENIIKMIFFFKTGMKIQVYIFIAHKQLRRFVSFLVKHNYGNIMSCGINDIQVAPLFCSYNILARYASNLVDDLRYIYTT